MRLLERLHGKRGAVGVVNLAVKREWLLLAIGGAQIVDKFDGRRLAQIVVEPKGLEIIRIDPRHQSQFHASTEHLVDDRNLFGQTQRMVQRHDIAHGADAHMARARPGADRVQARRRHPAFIGTEVMFDAETVVETKLVAERKLAPQFLVALMRGHAGLSPDMGKMSELHEASSLATFLIAYGT